MRTLEDWELVALAKQGDTSAFNTLLQRYQLPIYNLCFYLTQDRHIAEDLVQETFIRVYRHLPTIQPRAQFKTFIVGIARNLALNHIRNEARKKGFLSRFWEWFQANSTTNPNHLQANKHIDLEILKEKVQKCIDSLPYEYKEILLLREMYGLDYESIAQILGCRIGTVRSRLFRARAYLREKILNEGVIEQ